MGNPVIDPGYLPYFANAAAIVAILPCFLGFRVLLQPAWGFSNFSFPKPSTQKDEAVAYGLMRVIAARNLAVGLITLAIWYAGSGSYQALAVAKLGECLMVTVDGWVSLQVNGGGTLVHWAFIPVSLGTGLPLLGWI